MREISSPVAAAADHDGDGATGGEGKDAGKNTLMPAGINDPFSPLQHLLFVCHIDETIAIGGRQQGDQAQTQPGQAVMIENGFQRFLHGSHACTRHRGLDPEKTG
jgi:hypothetical protein